ncbi:L,D-transpeptidase family protein [Thioalkalicoccus limnaeus]|uniref:L,D-transpeptidase family protein n=1 Tax=Thioalkalicoccus limnaeus TaxID=120681 RepID=A0ABV4BAW4_9GAMM
MRLTRVLLLLLASLPIAFPAASNETLRQGLATLGEPARLGTLELASGPLLAEVYRARDYRLAWDPARIAAHRRLLEATRRDGFQRSDFHFREIMAWIERGDLATLSSGDRVEFELLLSDSLLRYLHHHRYGKVDPVALDAHWNHSSPPTFAALREDLGQALAAPNLEAHVRRTIRQPGFYSRLRDGLADYRAIAADGGWPTVPEGRTVRLGDQDEQVASIRARLAVTGDLRGPPAADPTLFDEGLKASVEDFQERHGLVRDGIVGPQTRGAMNVSVEDRINQIRVNLERMRWIYHHLPDDFVLVDIPGYRIDLVRSGRVVWTTRAIVGTAERQTPVFRDRLAYLEFNPTWTIPPTILAEDILPKMQEDPSYLQARGLRVIDQRGRNIPPETVDWHVPPRAFPYMLRQDPSDDNALGRVKFMFPNLFSVYLHDTPYRDLFDRSDRALSSGCVRVEDPMRLAELVLDEPARWNAESFQEIVASGQTRVVRLKEPLPVLLSYWTAEAGEPGQVRFRPDIYARDQQVLEALDGGRARPRIVVDESTGPG